VKKILVISAISIMVVFAMTACSGAEDGGTEIGNDETVHDMGTLLQGEVSTQTAAEPARSSGQGVIVIGERFFVNQFMEIMLNQQLYMGRNLQFEGMFFTTNFDGRDFHLVYRYTIGCCGEEPIGLVVDLGDFEPFADDAWVEVFGSLDFDYNAGLLTLRVLSIRELDERGSPVV